jgi:glycosyltransferase involved in cell wall biosynthesis
MKVAFVCQPFDVVAPPCLNSVGYYTWGAARALGPEHSVAVYACAHAHEHVDPKATSFPLRLIEASPRDLALFRIRTKLGPLFPIWSPLSTSSLLYPDYGRRVAVDLGREHWDVIHIQHCPQYAPLIRQHNPGARIVLQLHSEWFSQSDFVQVQSWLDSVDLLLGVSEHIARKLRRDFPKVASRCRALHYAVDPAEFAREKDYGAMRKRKQKRVLFAGAVSPQKGPHVLIDAFKILAQSIPDVHLDFAGGLTTYPIEENFDVLDTDTVRALRPYYSERLSSLIARRLGIFASNESTYGQFLRSQIGPELAQKVSFIGHIGERNSLVDRYYDADVFVFPPIWDEGFGIPPIEAMAAGTPVVGSRSGGLLETVEDGVTGFLTEKNDAQGLAERIQELLTDDDLKQQMGRAARNRVLSQFTWPVVARQMTSMYSELFTPVIPHLHVPASVQSPGQQLNSISTM